VELQGEFLTGELKDEELMNERCALQGFHATNVFRKTKLLGHLLREERELLTNKQLLWTVASFSKLQALSKKQNKD